VSTTKPAQATRSVLAATAAVFILVVVWTAGSLVKAGWAEAPHLVITKGRDSHDPGARRLVAASSQEQASQLQRPLEATQATPLDPMNRGSVTSLGDVSFTSGKADLRPAAMDILKRLVTFLAKYHDHSVSIQGYTDSVGNEGDNQELSERRANSVKAYLVAQGIDSTRLLAVGKGQSEPIAGNDSRSGRQQNRRVTVIIEDPPAAPAPPQRARPQRLIVLLMLLQSVSGHPGSFSR
jgi:outer membrane protein OmpA-like peptidoglycan-associated protein